MLIMYYSIHARSTKKIGKFACVGPNLIILQFLKNILTQL